MEGVTKSDGSGRSKRSYGKQGTIVIREAKEILVASSMGRGAVTESDALDGISEQSRVARDGESNPTGRRWKQSLNCCSMNLSMKSDQCSLQLIMKYSKKLKMLQSSR